MFAALAIVVRANRKILDLRTAQDNRKYDFIASFSRDTYVKGMAWSADAATLRAIAAGGSETTMHPY